MVMNPVKMLLVGFMSATSISLLCAEALADTTTSFQVNSAVNPACVVTADTLAFGSYDPLAVSPVNGETTIDVTCVDGAAYSIYLNAGLNSDSVLSRNMKGGVTSVLLAYELYTTTDYSGPVWGDGTVGTDFQCGIGTGSLQTYTVYGQIPAEQTGVEDDNYSDTVTVDVVY